MQLELSRIEPAPEKVYGGHSVCNACGKDMLGCWDIVCHDCGKTFCYNDATGYGPSWFCRECLASKKNVIKACPHGIERDDARLRG